MPKRNRKSRKVWFKKVRGSYLPVSCQGWLIYVPFVGTLLCGSIVVSNSTQRISIYGMSDTLALVVVAFLEIAVLFTVIGCLMTWIARQKS